MILQSRHLQEANYDQERGVLVIDFVDGSQHEYRVPESAYVGLITASSPGSYFHANIKGKPSQQVSKGKKR